MKKELIVRTEELNQTENNLIFIERNQTLSKEEIYRKIQILKAVSRYSSTQNMIPETWILWHWKKHLKSIRM